MTATADPLAAQGLTVRRGGREVLTGLDLTLRTGEVAVLLGANGAGKSTLLEALAGTLPASAGTVARRGRVALAMQSPDLARRSVRANVMLALAWWGVPRAERRERADAALAQLGAGHLAGRAAGALSGGERRRVHLARAVAVAADVLLLDEPFAGLDGASRAALLDDTGAALRGTASASLVVVHDRAEAWALADRMLLLADGRLLADGPPRALLEAPPTPEAARLLGYDGELAEPGGGRRLTLPHHVALDPAGPDEAEVIRAIPREDGLRLELRLARGTVFVHAPVPGPRRGERVRVRVTGGVAFPELPTG